MAAPEVPALTEEQAEQLREAAAKAAAALADFAAAFANAMSRVDWKGISEKLEQARLEMGGRDDVL